MKVRIAALALATAFLAAPAWGALGLAECPPCGVQPADAGPCTSLTAAPCCGDAAAAPAKPALDARAVHAIADSDSGAPISPPVLSLRAVQAIAAPISPLRLSVVRRL